MIRCEICNKTIPDNEKLNLDYNVIAKATKDGFVPSYFLKRDKNGIDYGLPLERKWVNKVKGWGKDSMDLCRDCYIEMTETPEPIKSKFYYCYIATVAFDSPEAPEVILLKNYRDQILLKNPFGRIFVDLYYLLSPPLSKIISKSDTLKNIVKICLLNPIIRKIQKDS
jgi:hypothetical protein